MQMQPGGMQPQARIQPDQLIQALSPILQDAVRVYDAGATLPSALQEAVLAGFLVGRGLSPAQAMDTVMQWRTSGAAKSLARAMRTESSPARAPQANRELARKIEGFIQDQANAAAFYGELMNLAKDPLVKDYIRHAMEDEQKHYRMLRELYRELTGRTYDAQPKKTEYKDLVDGLTKALTDELEAAEEYRDTYLGTDSRKIRDLFLELMTDEMEHATRFTFSLQVAEEEGEEEEEGETG